MTELVLSGWPHLGPVIAVAVFVLRFRERSTPGGCRWQPPALASGWVGPVLGKPERRARS